MSHLGPAASDTGAPKPCCVRCVMVLTAMNKHDPQQIWPQGVSVAFVGGEKQIGHVYAERRSGSGCDTGAGFACAAGGREADEEDARGARALEDAVCDVDGNAEDVDSIISMGEEAVDVGGVVRSRLGGLRFLARLGLLTGADGEV